MMITRTLQFSILVSALALGAAGSGDGAVLHPPGRAT